MWFRNELSSLAEVSLYRDYCTFHLHFLTPVFTYESATEHIFLIPLRTSFKYRGLWNMLNVNRNICCICVWSWSTETLFLYLCYLVHIHTTQKPLVGQSILIIEASRSQTHHTRQDPSARLISPSQRPLPDNTQQSQETDILAPAVFETTILAGELPQTCALDHAATGIGLSLI